MMPSRSDWRPSASSFSRDETISSESVPSSWGDGRHPNRVDISEKEKGGMMAMMTFVVRRRQNGDARQGIVLHPTHPRPRNIANGDRILHTSTDTIGGGPPILVELPFRPPPSPGDADGPARRVGHANCPAARPTDEARPGGSGRDSALDIPIPDLGGMGTDLEYILYALLRKLRRRGSRTTDGSRRVRCSLRSTRWPVHDRAQRFQRNPVRPVPITLRLFLGGCVWCSMSLFESPLRRWGRIVRLTDLGYLRQD